MKVTPITPFKLKQKQNGAVLFVSLMLLILMSLLGLSSIRGMIQEEKMVAGTYDRSIAFQAAEAALRIGEQKAEQEALTSNVNFPNSGLCSTMTGNTCVSGPSCTSALCTVPLASATDRWLDSGVAWAAASGHNLPTISGDPEYIVEYLGNNFACNPNDPTNNRNCAHYRVTARSEQIAGRASVMLQSIYNTDIH